MPLAVGRVWTFDVHGRRLGQVASMRVVRRLAVDGVEGYELAGPLGVSRLAWNGQRLVADCLCGTRYDPPIPLLDARLPSTPVAWRGAVQSPAASMPGQASLTHFAKDTMFGSRKTAAVETVLELQTGRRRMELDSWFVDGAGLVKQEERTDDVETVRLTMTGGP